TQNSIFSNGGLGIDLGDDGRTANDLGDPDSGANNLQNFPVLTKASLEGSIVIVEGKLNSTPNTFFTLEFFGNDASSPDEGKTYLGSIGVFTDADGNATFTVAFSAGFGDYVTATATDPDHNTSEFSDPAQVHVFATVGDYVWYDSNRNGLQ